MRGRRVVVAVAALLIAVTAVPASAAVTEVETDNWKYAWVEWSNDTWGDLHLRLDTHTEQGQPAVTVEEAVLSMYGLGVAPCEAATSDIDVHYSEKSAKVEFDAPCGHVVATWDASGIKPDRRHDQYWTEHLLEGVNLHVMTSERNYRSVTALVVLDGVVIADTIRDAYTVAGKWSMRRSVTSHPID